MDTNGPLSITMWNYVKLLEGKSSCICIQWSGYLTKAIDDTVHIIFGPKKKMLWNPHESCWAIHHKPTMTGDGMNPTPKKNGDDLGMVQMAAKVNPTLKW